jgi:hypothetical protein
MVLPPTTESQMEFPAVTVNGIEVVLTVESEIVALTCGPVLLVRVREVGFAAIVPLWAYPTAEHPRRRLMFRME